MITCIAAILFACIQEREDLVVESTVGLAPGSSGTVRLCLGGAVDELRKSDPEAAGALVKALGVSAVNVSDDDLAAGEAVVRALAARLPLVSASCPLAKPYVVVGRIGITGVTRGAGDPAEALARVLPALRKESDVVVLMAWLDRTAAAALVRKFPEIRVVLHAGVGVFDPEPLRIGESFLLRGPAAKWTVARTRLGTTVSHGLEPGPSEVSKELTELAGKCGLTEHPLRAAIEKSVATETPSAIPTKLEPEKPAVVGRSASNRAVRIEVKSVTLRAGYGGRKGRLLLVDTEWENTIPMTLVYERQIPTAYVVQELRDHVYLVVNGARLSRLETGLPGLVPRTLKLDRLGDRLRGGLLFELPSEGLETLELRFYDYAHGHAAVPLLGRAKEEKPLQAGANEIVEVGVYGVRQVTAEGKSYVAMDLRARSVLKTTMDDAEVGVVADWKEAGEYVRAIVDGEYAYAPERRLPETLRFLPDAATGEIVYFLLPEKRVSLELRCDFPNAALPNGEVVHPEAVTLLLEGKRPEAPERESIAEVEDGSITVAVWGQSVAREFAGAKAGKGKKFLVVDVTVTATESEFFQAKEQLKYGTEKGGQIGVHKSAWAGAKRPTEKVWVPAGERRTFQLVFEIPETEKKFRLAYAGYTKAETLELKEGE